MKARVSRRLALIAGTAVLATAMTGTMTASAKTPDTVCSAEVEIGAVAYRLCNNTYNVGTTEYGTEPYAAIRNRGIASVNVTVTHQRWNYTTNAWETDNSGPKLIPGGSSTWYFSPSRSWPCGEDAQERVQVTTPDGTGPWAELYTLSEC